MVISGLLSLKLARMIEKKEKKEKKKGKLKQAIFVVKILSLVILDARGFLREELWNSDKQSVKREKIEKTWENLWLPATVDWSYCANRFELGSRSGCVIIGCLLIDLVMLSDSYRSTIVRFASRVTRGFFVCRLTFFSRRKKTSGTRVVTSIIIMTSVT